jgi:AraC-like DNA-binding protein
MARAAHASPSHFARQFREAYGETPYAYLMTRRIERAKALLRAGELSVTEVSLAVGCQSLGTFSTRFRELVGVTPGEYRVQVRDVPGVPPCAARMLTRPSRNREAGTLAAS